mgnify:FL=1
MGRWLRRLGFALLGCALAFGVGTLLGAPVAWPFDVVVNFGAPVEAPDLRAPDDGRVRVVVLQHGLFRTRRSLDRLERTLRANGYEVLNPGYPSTQARIEAHAERLAAAIARRVAAGPVDEFSFVGHSMGGLVIQEYLRRPDAQEPAACVYLATPHRGALLADARRHWFLFRLAMGSEAAVQLATTDAFHAQPIPFGARSGTIIGDVGDGNGSIPGRDDGTVGVDEATFAGAAASCTVPYGHTRITLMPAVHRQVLHFLRHRAFAAGPEPR